jgi:putative cell wall-binding protein
MVKAINDVVMKPVQNIRKDVYAFAGEYSVKKFGKSEKVIIARGDLGVDSIASVTYAMTLNVPILLVEPCAIPKPTAKALKKLETRSVTIVGGPVAVSEEVAKKLPNASRMFGQNRHETAVKIAEALMAQIEVDTVVITDGIDPDPISIILASKYHAPIIYTEGDNVPPVTQEFLRNKFRIIMVGVTDAAALKIKSIAGFK